MIADPRDTFRAFGDFFFAERFKIRRAQDKDSNQDCARSIAQAAESIRVPTTLAVGRKSFFH